MSRMYLVRLLLFFNDTATTEIYTLSLHDALPIFRAHAELPSLCEHVHLPLQSGSSRILKAMRRTYTRERYLDRVRLIREDRKSTRLNSSHANISYAVFCLKKNNRNLSLLYFYNMQ